MALKLLDNIPTTLKFIILIHSCFCTFIVCNTKKKTKEQTSSDSEKFLRVSYQSLLKATDGFSSATWLVWAVLAPFILVRHGASKSFTAECEAHSNLEKVLSACSGSDYSSHDFKALIYDVMVTGSLEEWLHPIQTIGETNKRPKSSTFSQRLNIVIDVAMALDYMHHHCQTPIVHCHLKPSDVLLNDDMTGHVGDFGLARFLPKTFDGNHSSSIG
ncbi:hypothetical protein Pyn_25892 [Prunus yedoensis var. nudiflora]|uniref:Protein kinase domain-containing protein n=1 Tax=Prunus yedoensis var. nudiflora TaxID=2094558 RepID=A0A314XPJ1_PRUYE|nr:hypothetical protein Pyn_25892 [Prunus yedoensis var. nudiflora]